MGVTLRMPERTSRPRRREPAKTPAAKRVVAVILSDGTVREVGEGRSSGADTPGWSSGAIAGRDWTLWWERRSWRN
jgi:hypothetical protein